MILPLLSYIASLWNSHFSGEDAPPKKKTMKFSEDNSNGQELSSMRQV